MSEVPRPLTALHTEPAWLTHAAETAQWMVQLLAWLWLGQQGVRLGWPLASGVLAVALWWAVRVLCRGTGWALRCPSAWMAVCGAVVAVDVWLSAVAGAPAGTLWALLALAALWGVWSALIETRSLGRRQHAAHRAWQPVLAASLLGLAWGLPAGAGVRAGAVALLLGLCAAVLYARDRRPGLRAHACKGASGTLSHLPAPSAMGLMMGTLWLGGDWCMGSGWTQEQAVAAHVALMAGLPALLALLLQVLKERRGMRLSPAAHDAFSLGCITLSGGLWLGSSTAHGVLAMALASCAWALHCKRPRVVLQVRAQLSNRSQRYVALLLGPALLVWVGMASAQQGPLAMRYAFVLLGALSGYLLLRAGLQACQEHFQKPAIARSPIA